MEMKTHGLKLNLGDNAPDFNLIGVDDKNHILNEFKSKSALAVVFMCNHCPYVQANTERLIKMQKEFAGKGVQFIGINSNDEKLYQEDGFDKMKVYARIRGFNFPYLRDADQKVAKAYDAQCTPEAYVFDKDRKLRYHGRIDDNYQDLASVKSPDLKDAIAAIVDGKEVTRPLTNAIGCSIKWV